METNKCCCGATQEVMKDIEAIIEKHQTTKGNLIPILHDIQETYGYIPSQAQEKIAKKLNISQSEIYGVITFYHRFSLEPKGKYRISVCIGTACYVKGAGDILDKFEEKLQIKTGESTKDGILSLETCRCLGACGLAPTILVNDKVYGCITKDSVEEIIEKYKNMAKEQVATPK